MKSLLQEFKAFIMRGNVVDLAVAVIIGGAFGALVTSLTKDVLMQIINGLTGKKDFSKLVFHVNKSTVFYGNFVTAVVNFLIIAAALFAMIKLMEKMQNLRKQSATEDVDTPAPSDETVLLSEIRDLLKTQAR